MGLKKEDKQMNFYETSVEELVREDHYYRYKCGMNVGRGINRIVAVRG